MTHLDKIITAKKLHVAQQKKLITVTDLIKRLETLPASRNFCHALQQSIAEKHLAIIAEIKKASPSKGVIRADFDPVNIALQYQAAGATCLSVLTDQAFFQGSDAIFQHVRSVCDLPMLRKDFMIDPYQIIESRTLGADCILLIVAALRLEELHALAHLATQLGMAVLIESHNEQELTQALTVTNAIIGINNRNLHTFETTLSTSTDLMPLIPSGRLVVSESGIQHSNDIQQLLSHGIHSFLIGESLMRAENPGNCLKELISAH
jgi:indole-3-glycerol phosphate synthase